MWILRRPQMCERDVWTIASTSFRATQARVNNVWKMCGYPSSLLAKFRAECFAVTCATDICKIRLSLNASPTSNTNDLSSGLIEHVLLFVMFVAPLSVFLLLAPRSSSCLSSSTCWFLLSAPLRDGFFVLLLFALCHLLPLPLPVRLLAGAPRFPHSAWLDVFCLCWLVVFLLLDPLRDGEFLFPTFLVFSFAPPGPIPPLAPVRSLGPLARWLPRLPPQGFGRFARCLGFFVLRGPKTGLPSVSCFLFEGFARGAERGAGLLCFVLLPVWWGLAPTGACVCHVPELITQGPSISESGVTEGPHATKLPQSWAIGSDQSGIPAILMFLSRLFAFPMFQGRQARLDSTRLTGMILKLQSSNGQIYLSWEFVMCVCVCVCVSVCVSPPRMSIAWWLLTSIQRESHIAQTWSSLTKTSSPIRIQNQVMKVPQLLLNLFSGLWSCVFFVQGNFLGVGFQGMFKQRLSHVDLQSQGCHRHRGRAACRGAEPRIAEPGLGGENCHGCHGHIWETISAIPSQNSTKQPNCEAVLRHCIEPTCPQ